MPRTIDVTDTQFEALTAISNKINTPIQVLVSRAVDEYVTRAADRVAHDAGAAAESQAIDKKEDATGVPRGV